jgi:hypothetical protein
MKTVRLFVIAMLLIAPWPLAAQEANPPTADAPGVEAEAASTPPTVEKAEAEPGYSTEAENAFSEKPNAAQVKAEAEPNDESSVATEDAKSDGLDASVPLREPILESDKPRVVYPPDRPAWVDSPPNKKGEIERIAVSSGPHVTAGEARRQLEEAIRQAAADYVNHHLGANNAAQYISYQDEVKIVDDYEEVAEFSIGPMRQAHALLEFDETFRGKIEQEWKEALTLSRLMKTGLGSAAVFLLLSVILGYFRADTATRGYYTRRLRFGAATVILVLAAAIYVAVRYIPWMI